MNPLDSLPVIAEISLGLVGFTAVVSAGPGETASLWFTFAAISPLASVTARTTDSDGNTATGTLKTCGTKHLANTSNHNR